MSNRQRRTLKRKHALLSDLAREVSKIDPFLEAGDGSPGTAECFYCDANEEYGSGHLEDHEPWCLWRRIVQVMTEPIEEDHPASFNPPRFKMPQGKPGTRKPGPATAQSKVKVSVADDKTVVVRYESIGSIDDDNASERAVPSSPGGRG